MVGGDGGGNVYGGGIENGARHLGRDKTFPDEVVKFELVVVEILANGIGFAKGFGGANGFVGFFRACHLFGIDTRFGGQIFFAKFLSDVFQGFFLRGGGNVGGIGAHIGDEPGLALFAYFETVIEFLRDFHGALGVESEAARGVLLKRRGDVQADRDCG